MSSLTISYVCLPSLLSNHSKGDNQGQKDAQGYDTGSDSAAYAPLQPPSKQKGGLGAPPHRSRGFCPAPVISTRFARCICTREARHPIRLPSKTRSGQRLTLRPRVLSFHLFLARGCFCGRVTGHPSKIPSISGVDCLLTLDQGSRNLEGVTPWLPK